MLKLNVDIPVPSATRDPRMAAGHFYRCLRDTAGGMRRGEDYVLFRDHADRLVAHGVVEPIDAPSDVEAYGGQNLDGEKLYILPRMGIGDVVATTLLLVNLHRRYPIARLHFVDWGYGIVGRPPATVVHALPAVRDMRGMRIINLEDNCQDPLFRYGSYFEGLLARAFLFERDPDLRPIVHVEAALRTRLSAAVDVRGRDRPLVLLNFLAGSKSRRLPPALVQDVIDAGEDRFHFVFINPKGSSDARQYVRIGPNGRVSDWSHLSADPAHYVALLSLLDGVITCDSAAQHIAAGLDVPSVCVYSTKHRKRYPYPRAIGMNSDYAGRTCRAPCELDIAGDTPCPEARALGEESCPCMRGISGSAVVDAMARGLDGRCPRPPSATCPACGGALHERRLTGAARAHACSDCGLLLRERDDAVPAGPVAEEMVARVVSYLAAGKSARVLDITPGHAEEARTAGPYDIINIRGGGTDGASLRAMLAGAAARLAPRGHVVFTAASRTIFDYMDRHKSWGVVQGTLWTRDALIALCRRAGLAEPAVAGVPLSERQIFEMLAPLAGVDPARLHREMVPLLMASDFCESWLVVCPRRDAALDLDRLLRASRVATQFAAAREERML